MDEYISIPFPKDLYHKILIRSGGRLDPAYLAVDQVEAFVDRNRFDGFFWTEEGVEAWEEEAEAEKMDAKGDPKRGYQWQQLFLPNGTELRMTYKGNNQYAEVRHEKIVFEGKTYSPSKWVSKVAGNTSRNAWRDIWVRLPGRASWEFADDLRRKTSPRG